MYNIYLTDFKLKTVSISNIEKYISSNICYLSVSPFEAGMEPGKNNYIIT